MAEERGKTRNGFQWEELRFSLSLSRPLSPLRLLLKLPGLPVTGSAHAHGVVPASRGHGPALRGAVITHALSAGPAVVLGQLGAELAPTAVAAQDVLVGHPVGGPCRVLHQTWGERAPGHAHAGTEEPG